MECGKGVRGPRKNLDDCMSLPFPSVLLGQGQKEVCSGRSPTRLISSVHFCKLLVFRRNQLSTSWASTISVFFCSLSFPREGHITCRALPLLFLLNFPFCSRRWWGRRMSLPPSSNLPWSRDIDFFFSFCLSCLSFSSFPPPLSPSPSAVLLFWRLTSKTWGE